MFHNVMQFLNEGLNKNNNNNNNNNEKKFIYSMKNRLVKCP